MFIPHSLLPRSVTLWKSQPKPWLHLPDKHWSSMLSWNPLPVPHAALPYFTAKNSDAGHAQACTFSRDKVIKKQVQNNKVWSYPHAVARRQWFFFSLSLRKKLRFYFRPPPLPLSKYFVSSLTPFQLLYFFHTCKLCSGLPCLKQQVTDGQLGQTNLHNLYNHLLSRNEALL